MAIVTITVVVVVVMMMMMMVDDDDYRSINYIYSCIRNLIVILELITRCDNHILRKNFS